MIRTYMVIGIMIIAMACTSAAAQETMQFKSEAKKLDFIRQMLKKEKHLRLSEYSASHCKQMMKDLLAGKNFKAIEPYLKASSEDDERLARWNQCRDKDYHDVDVDSDKFFGDLSDLGGPPYRFYRIELDGNSKNGPEDIVYTDTFSDQNSSSGAGYSWVNLKNCEIKCGYPVGELSQFSKKPNAASLNTLVYYKGQLWAMDYVEGIGFDLQRRIDCNKMETCQWWFDDPKAFNEEPDDLCKKLSIWVKNKDIGKYAANSKTVSDRPQDSKYTDLDIDTDGKIDNVVVSSGSEGSYLEVELSSGGKFDLEENGYIMILKFQEQSYALVTYWEWDMQPDGSKIGKEVSHRLYLLTKQGAKMICAKNQNEKIIKPRGQ